MIVERTMSVNVRGVPEAVKERLLEEARQRGVTLNDVAVGALAEFFEAAPGEPSGRRTTAPTLSDQLQLRMPGPLAAALYSYARRRGWTQSGAAVSVLARRYELDYAPPRRGGRPR